MAETSRVLLSNPTPGASSPAHSCQSWQAPTPCRRSGARPGYRLPYHCQLSAPPKAMLGDLSLPPPLPALPDDTHTSSWWALEASDEAKPLFLKLCPTHHVPLSPGHGDSLVSGLTQRDCVQVLHPMGRRLPFRTLAGPGLGHISCLVRVGTPAGLGFGLTCCSR